MVCLFLPNPMRQSPVIQACTHGQVNSFIQSEEMHLQIGTKTRNSVFWGNQEHEIEHQIQWLELAHSKTANENK